jgi:exodeoxyribonuclease V alpha subunit
VPSLFRDPDEQPKYVLEGVLERITFQSESDGFTVARFSVTGVADLVTAVGNLPGVRVGESLRLSGEWVDDRRYGRQFRVRQYVPVLPTTALGIERYLASGIIKGIGRATAAKIVEHFAERTLDVLTEEPGRLREVLGVKTAEKVAREWAGQRAVHEAMVFLQSVGMGTALAAKIWKQYGARAIEIVKTDPYRLAAEVTGVGFLTADRIAAGIGVPPSSPERAQAGAMHVLREASGEGHCYLEYEALERQAAALLGPDGAPIRAAVAELSARRLVVVEGDAVYAQPLHEAETAAAERLRALLDSPPADVSIDADRELAWYEGQAGIILAAAQREALLNAIRGKVAVITGGPGTGKTTIVKGLVRIFGAKSLRVLLCAPTGRAAKRLAEASGAPAKTIHRLLEYNPGSGGFQRNPGRPLEADVVIADESSMIDISLFRLLLEAIPLQARLVLVGDADQLPSVGPGSVLRDVIDSGAAAVVRLTQIFRQAERSFIVTNAHRVLHGEPPVPEGDDFAFLEREDPEEALRTLVELATRGLPERLGIPTADIQVIVPMHRGTLGSQSVNAALQERLNPAGAKVAGRAFRVGDKIMQVKNNYNLDVFNGDLGFVEQFDADAGVLVARFDGRPKKFALEDLDQLDLSYACTIHKSQGSEYPAVVVALHTQHFPMLQRNLLYTAITRGKHFVAIVGSKRALRTAIANDRVRERWTGLLARLKG